MAKVLAAGLDQEDASSALFALVKKATPLLLALSNLISLVPVLGRKLRYFVPVANYHGVNPLSKAQHMEFSTPMGRFRAVPAVTGEYTTKRASRRGREWSTCWMPWA